MSKKLEYKPNTEQLQEEAEGRYMAEMAGKIAMGIYSIGTPSYYESDDQAKYIYDLAEAMLKEHKRRGFKLA